MESGQLRKNTVIEIKEYSKSVAKKVNHFSRKYETGARDKMFTLIQELVVLNSDEMTASSPQTQTSNPFLPPATKKIKPNPYVGIIDLDENYNTLSEWKIRGRVTAKSEIRPWQNAKGHGTTFSFDMQDETGKIRATSYSDKLYDMIEVCVFFPIPISNMYINDVNLMRLVCSIDSCVFV